MAEGEELDLVADILATPFSRRTFQEKLELLRRGRPTPMLTSLSQQGKLFDLSESMGQLHALACLAVTIPVSTASVERLFSALKRIKMYARNTTGHTRLSALASMSIKKDLLMELKHTDNLYSRAI